jgi:hypothetical protein
MRMYQEKEYDNLVPLNMTEKTAIGELRRLIEEKTRFSQDDIALVREQTLFQSFYIDVQHHIQEKVEIQPINGFFTAGPDDKKSDNPKVSAEADISSRRRIAAEKIAHHLQGEDVTYNYLKDGLILSYTTKHWFLEQCNVCHGQGLVTCHHCNGACKVTCGKCGGKGDVACWICRGTGDLSCTRCNGAKGQYESIPYSASRSVYSNGSYQTQYHTDYRKEWRSCSNCGATGLTPCLACGTSGRETCSSCGGGGSVTCQACGGEGKLMCNPCSGTGETGLAGWVDVYCNMKYVPELPDDAYKEAAEILDRTGVHGIAANSRAIRQVALAQDDTNLPSQLTARYEGELRLTYLDTRCNGNDYHLVAYGDELHWHTMGGILESLLSNDLEALRSALADCATNAIWDANIANVLAPLAHVTASELNAEIVESALDGRDVAELGVVVSGEYASQIKSALLGAVGLIYNRMAKRLWWKISLAASFSSIALWAVSSPAWAGFAGLVVAVLGWFVLERQVRNLLAEAIGGEDKAKRVIRMASSARRNLAARVLTLLLPSAVAIGMLSLLPTRGVLTGPLISAPQGMAETHEPTPIVDMGQSEKKLQISNPVSSEEISRENPPEKKTNPQAITPSSKQSSIGGSSIATPVAPPVQRREMQTEAVSSAKLQTRPSDSEAAGELPTEKRVEPRRHQYRIE